MIAYWKGGPSRSHRGRLVGGLVALAFTSDMAAGAAAAMARRVERAEKAQQENDTTARATLRLR